MNVVALLGCFGISHTHYLLSWYEIMILEHCSAKGSSTFITVDSWKMLQYTSCAGQRPWGCPATFCPLFQGETYFLCYTGSWKAEKVFISSFFFPELSFMFCYSLSSDPSLILLSALIQVSLYSLSADPSFSLFTELCVLRFILLTKHWSEFHFIHWTLIQVSFYSQISAL